MTKQRVLNVLAPLASSAYQRRYILNGTANEYVRADDLLEDVISLCGFVQAHPDVLETFTESERRAVDQGLSCMSNNISRVAEDIDNLTLIERDSAWENVREQANYCLRQLGLDLQGWEDANL